ncbi:MAG: substrate-binding domain-containing protein [Desulfobacterales bacterium]|nr:substrate-binding domain-containing protein [Desulfobacterales bacterium]
MKRITVVLVIGVLLLTACAPKGVPAEEAAAPEESEVVAPPAEKEKYVIGVSYEGPTNDWAASMMYHLQYSFDIKYADQVEAVYYESADGDATKQVGQVENLLTKGIDALMLQPLSETAMVPIVEKATEMGIPVIIFGSSVLTDKYVTYVDRDNYGAGKTIATWICEQMGGEGKVVTIMGEPGSGYSEDVLRGVSDALLECPDIENVGTEYGEYSAAVTKQKMEPFLGANPDIGGVIVDGGMMGMGILEAYDDAGLAYPFMTVDDWNGFQKKAVEIGYTDYMSIPGGSEASAVAADLLFDFLAGKDVPAKSLIEVGVMTGPEVQAMIPEGMPDSYWALCRIPPEHVGVYYSE